MIFSVKIPTQYTKMLLKLTNEFSEIERYKINIKKWTEFLYISNEQVETENFKYHLNIVKKYERLRDKCDK